MRILFSLTYYTPYVSGLTLYVKRLAERLAKKDYQVSVISFQFKKKLALKETINRVKVIRVKPLFKISKGFISIDWFAKSFAGIKEASVIFINLPQFEGFIPALWGRILGRRVIAIYHCEVKLPSGLLNYFLETILNLANRLTLLLAQSIITYTEDFAYNSRILPYFQKKIKCCYPPVNKPIINKRVQKIIREKIGRKPGFVIGVAARLAAEKGIEYLLESIPYIEEMLIPSSRAKSRDLSRMRARTSREIPPHASLGRNYNEVLFKIIVAGPMEPVGEEKYRKKILKLIEKFRKYVVFLGELDEEDMGSFYSLLDVLVLPSVNSTEAFGMVQVEAMMMGVGVVATDLQGVRVPIEKTGMGKIVAVRNSKKLAEAIVEVLKNKQKYIKNKGLAQREFLIDKTIFAYDKILKSL